ncbi:MAG: pseudouridine synthase [Chitinophagales bacterium]
MDTSLQILFEDNHLIAVNKRPGDISQGDKTGNTPLVDIVAAYIKEKISKAGNVCVALLPHRIDRPVSGVLLFAKTSKAAERMSADIQTRDFKKHTGPSSESTSGNFPLTVPLSAQKCKTE